MFLADSFTLIFHWGWKKFDVHHARGLRDIHASIISMPFTRKSISIDDVHLQTLSHPKITLFVKILFSLDRRKMKAFILTEKRRKKEREREREREREDRGNIVRCVGSMEAT